MSRSLPAAVFSLSVLTGTAALADVPKVAVDIAPVHSLVARVMLGVGAPDLIVKPGASPHEYSLRPSEARALQDADLVFMVGGDLTPWLEKAVETLAEGAQVTELMHAEETKLLDLREGALFEAHSHDDHDADDDHDHETHGDHGEEEHAHSDHEEHEEYADHDDHGHDDHDHDDHDDHGHGAHDAHVWLSHENAKGWLNLIAARLSAADPENAGAYYANAAAGQAELEGLGAEITATLAPVKGMKFIVFHDAYQYFEDAFDFSASGAISLSDASEPGPARIAEIQARIKDEGIDCVLSEPQFNPGLVAAVLGGLEAGVGVSDPLGASLAPGPDLYPQLLKSLAETLATCG